jgi:hypothetical protein
VEQACPYVVSQATSKTERNRRRMVLLIIERQGFLVSGCFDVAKPDAARIELSSWQEEEARGNLNKRRETDGER